MRVSGRLRHVAPVVRLPVPTISRGNGAARQCVLVTLDLRVAGEPALRRSAQPLFITRRRESHLVPQPVHVGDDQRRPWGVIGSDIVGFTGGQNDPDRNSMRVGAQVDFARKPAPRAAQSLALVPPCTGGAEVRPDDGALDHLQGVRLTAAIGEGLQQHIP